MKRVAAAAISFAFAVITLPAAADQMSGSAFVSGNWRGSAYDAKGQFSHCAMSAGYASGISMHFSVSQDWTWRVGWGHRDWRLEGGRQIPITFWIDNFPPRQLIARAQQSTFAIAELPAQADVFDQFRRGYLLTVVAEGQRYPFSLQGTYAALTTLTECVKQYRQFAGTTPQAAPTATPQNRSVLPRATPEQRLEATKVVANILAQSELEGFRILTDKEVKDIGNEYVSNADVVWQAQGLLGLLRIIPKDAAQSSDDIASLILADDSKACKGTFVSGFTADDIGGSAKRMFSACDSTLAAIILRYTIVPMADGSHYLFTTTGRKGEQGNKESIDKAEGSLRRAVYNVTGR